MIKLLIAILFLAIVANEEASGYPYPRSYPRRRLYHSKLIQYGGEESGSFKRLPIFSPILPSGNQIISAVADACARQMIHKGQNETVAFEAESTPCGIMKRILGIEAARDAIFRAKFTAILRAYHGLPFPAFFNVIRRLGWFKLRITSEERHAKIRRLIEELYKWKCGRMTDDQVSLQTVRFDELAGQWVQRRFAIKIVNMAEEKPSTEKPNVVKTTVKPETDQATNQTIDEMVINENPELLPLQQRISALLRASNEEWLARRLASGQVAGPAANWTDGRITIARREEMLQELAQIDAELRMAEVEVEKGEKGRQSQE